MKDLYHVHYDLIREGCIFIEADSREDAVQKVQTLSHAALVARLDLDEVYSDVRVHEDSSHLPYLGSVPDETGEILIFKSDRAENGVVFYQKGKVANSYTIHTWTDEELKDQIGIHAIALHLLNRFNKKQAKSEE